MILSLKSTGPDYHYLRSNIQIPWNCEYVKYHVESINTRDVCVATDDDFIEILYWKDDPGDGKMKKFTFKNTYHVTTAQVKLMFQLKDKEYVTQDNPEGYIMKVTKSHDCRIIIEMIANVTFMKMTRLSGLVTGLYNVQREDVYEEGNTYLFDKPIKTYYDKLYLVSKQGQAIQSNIGNKEYTPSIIVSIDHIIREGTPIIYNFEQYGKPIKNIVNIDSFKQIELELVDFEFQPIKLMSPMFVTIKIKPCDNPKMMLK